MRDEQNSIRPIDDAGSRGQMMFQGTKAISNPSTGVHATDTWRDRERRGCRHGCETERLFTPCAKQILYDPTQTARSFADLPHYQIRLLKHKEIGKLFDIRIPFTDATTLARAL